jgi:hypothetical protein
MFNENSAVAIYKGHTEAKKTEKERQKNGLNVRFFIWGAILFTALAFLGAP